MLLNLIGQSPVKKTYTKISLYAAKSDAAYWRTRPYQDRLFALEEIRQEYHRRKYGAEPRLQRVYTIAQRREH
jgi:hypothetical protein